MRIRCPEGRPDSLSSPVSGFLGQEVEKLRKQYITQSHQATQQKGEKIRMQSFYVAKNVLKRRGFYIYFQSYTVNKVTSYTFLTMKYN